MKTCGIYCIRLFLIVVFMSCLSEMNGQDYFGKHILILVDQTPDAQKNMGENYSYLYDLLVKGTIDKKLPAGSYFPDNFKFDEAKDQLTVFGFGIIGAYVKIKTSSSNDSGNGKNANPGLYNMRNHQRLENNKTSQSESPQYQYKYTGDYKEIHDLSRDNKISTDDFNKRLEQALIHKRADLKSSKLQLKEFLKCHLKPLMNKEDSVAKQIADNKISGITMSLYVQKAVLDFIDTNNYAENYYIIVVSNYKGFGNCDTEDQNRLVEITANNKKYSDSFLNHLNALNAPYYYVEDIELKNDIESKDATIVKGMSLNLRALQGSSVAVKGNVSIRQKNFGGKEFVLDNVEISFNHPNENFAVQKIQIELDDKRKFHKVLDVCKDDYVYDKANDLYIIPERTFTVDESLDTKQMSAKFLFYTMGQSKGKNLIPQVFAANRDDIPIEFAPNPAESNTTLIIVISSIVVCVILFVIAYFIYKRRGLKKDIDVDFRIWPISNTRFMEVKNQEVINYDCWYWNGINDMTRSIQVSGHLKVKEKHFAKNYRYLVSYQVMDEDANYDFSFRPSERENNGEYKTVDKYYRLIENDKSTNYSFSVSAYIDDSVSEPNFDKDNILKLGVRIKVERLDDKGVVNEIVYEGNKSYVFIVKPSIENQISWVAFDPGTTGACIAYGNTNSLATRDNIFMVENTEESIQGEKRNSHIFPSKIRITQNSALFRRCPVESLKETVDFDFGNKAQILWGRNCFQSIKKLLGYSESQMLYNDKGNACISGRDLAFLLVKGLYNKYLDYVSKNKMPDGSTFSAQRAIVAVPNNYTIPKVQAMVDSVKRLNEFKEVHYIYESEAVFMTYLKSELANLNYVKNNVFVVYDMGGATINITAFVIEIINQANSNNIQSITVKTIAKVGYNVGGDDIDYSIIQFIYHMPSIKDSFGNVEENLLNNQKKHKNFLVDMARKIKLDYIDFKYDNANLKEDNVFGGKNFDLFLQYVTTSLRTIGIQVELQDNDQNYVKKFIDKFTVKLVDGYVVDAVKELLSSIKDNSNGRTVSLIMSGRSVLFPTIHKNVKDTIRKDGYKIDEWSGFMHNDSTYDGEKVKTAVAQGACWYAMNSGQINLDHNILTTTFGYIDMENNKNVFVPVIDKRDNLKFIYGTISNNRTPIDTNLHTVEFVQMLGTDYDKIYDGQPTIKHKMNLLTTVSAQQITGPIQDIKIIVDDKNNFGYEITIAGISEPIKKAADSNVDIKAIISDENSVSYIFAAINATDEKISFKDNSSRSSTATHRIK